MQSICPCASEKKKTVLPTVSLPTDVEARENRILTLVKHYWSYMSGREHRSDSNPDSFPPFFNRKIEEQKKLTLLLPTRDKKTHFVCLMYTL